MTAPADPEIAARFYAEALDCIDTDGADQLAAAFYLLGCIVTGSWYLPDL